MIKFDPTQLLRQLMQTLTVGSPILLVYAIGAYLAITSFQSGRRSSVLLLCGIAINVFVMVAGDLVFRLVLVQVTRSDAAAVLAELGFLQNLLFAVGVGLIVAAVFADRTPQTHPPD